MVYHNNYRKTLLGYISTVDYGIASWIHPGTLFAKARCLGEIKNAAGVRILSAGCVCLGTHIYTLRWSKALSR